MDDSRDAVATRARQAAIEVGRSAMCLQTSEAIERGTKRRRTAGRNRVAVTGLVVVSLVAAILVPHLRLHASATSPSPGATTSPPATTSSSTLPPPPTSIPIDGSVPVTYAHAQLRVPSSWLIINVATDACEFPRPPSTIWVGLLRLTNCFDGTGLALLPPDNRVILSPPAPILAGRFTGSITVNGFLVRTYDWGPSADYYQPWSKDTSGYFVPALGVDIITSGPLGRAVVHTLRRVAA